MALPTRRKCEFDTDHLEEEYQGNRQSLGAILAPIG